jgi:hypothetical protein
VRIEFGFDFLEKLFVLLPILSRPDLLEHLPQLPVIFHQQFQRVHTVHISLNWSYFQHIACGRPHNIVALPLIRLSVRASFKPSP